MKSSDATRSDWSGTEASTNACPPSLRRAQVALLGSTLILSCFYFFPGGGWNQASHFDLVRALTEQGTVRIDSYHENTGDKSVHGGHYYSNKAPGTAFMASPFVAGLRMFTSMFGLDPGTNGALLWQGRVATLMTSTAPTAGTAVILFVLAMRLGASCGAALFAALTFGLGTPAWAYGTIFWSHPLATVCLVSAFAVAIAGAKEDLPGCDLKRSAAVGLTSGWACITEFQSVGAALFICLIALWRRREGKARVFRVLLAMIGGALIPILLLGIYNHAAFGSPFRLSYGSVVNFKEGHGEGVLGVTYPKMDVLLELLVGSRRGLLPLSPVLIVAPIGLVLLLRSSSHRLVALSACILFTYYLLFNSSFHYWWGGWCYGSRFMAPGIAFLGVGLAPAWDFVRREWRWCCGLLAIVSIFLTLVAVSTNPMPPEDLDAPFRQLLWPSFIEGRLSLNGGASFSNEVSPSMNAGEWMGLRGKASLIPLGVLWVGAGALWILIRWRIGSPAAEAEFVKRQ